jgi:hypothetical protein
MYHEERVIDGILNWRGTPDGEFKPYGQRELTRLLLAEREAHISNLRAAANVE